MDAEEMFSGGLGMRDSKPYNHCMRLILIVLIAMSPLFAHAKPLWCEKLLAWAGMETSETTVRVLAPDDRLRALEIVEHQEVWRMVSRKSHPEFLQSYRNRLYQGSEINFDFAIDFGGKMVGVVSLSPYVDFAKELDLPRGTRWYEIGYMIEPSYWGLGIGQRSMGRVLELAFGPIGASGLIAFVKPENARSLAVLNKFGFTLQGERDGVLIMVRRRMSGFQL
jgi:RimJ/RimL family protein N-acetyltransferase